MNISEWRSYFLDRGIKEDLLGIYLSYIRKLNKFKVPVIFELDHLSSLLGINVKFLTRMISSPEDFYRNFLIPKRSGGKREISAPHQSILYCQRWILVNILTHIPIHYSAHGFCAGKSIKSNAQIHLNSKSLLKMDLKDFFPSIPKSWIINIFSDLGYAPNVSYYLASLCCYNDHLAQGAATSPALSNIVLRGLDNRLQSLADKCGLRYSRYADDLTFSGDKISVNFPELVEGIIHNYGLTVNKDKTRLKAKFGSRIVTGVSISGGSLSVPREYKRNLKNEIFFIRKFGILSHVSKKKIKNPNYIYSLLGKLAFWSYIEPENEYPIEAKKFLVELIKD
ncbi:RNA-dependent DNA polymerase [Chromobacterium violaceum]|uniref:retron St85 family RNA-directed DNA polymerase n=1 Tax=Chromobacterium violaceum TaxID=536 RepID=UPI0009D99F9F|nr:retron St85 family RNA-directed DNA polymerase [Chromobacterium violaceum]OQS09738.1 RNA-dependent DNA polymerase [Chromobacterium violaceum]OQS25600.1 RNA-dependent DNA polymerase [Chromobacterium violaceum]